MGKELNFVFEPQSNNPDLVFVELEDENGYGIGDHPKITRSTRDGFYVITVTLD